MFIPYWDCALDYPLPEPADSAVWTPDFWGEAVNEVDNGPFANWVAPSDTCRNIGANLLRNTNNNKDDLYNKKLIEMLLEPTTYAGLMLRPAAERSSEFEKFHGGPHNFVGGHMADIRCSPLDPVFWMHHSFVDCLWQEWIDNGNDNTYPEIGEPGVTEYGLGVNPDDQMKNALMKPVGFMGNIKNNDGFRSNFYAGYHQRPSKIQCTEDADCHRAGDLKLLWCDTCINCCVAKIKEGGSCEGFIDKDNACYCRDDIKTPKCQENICVCL